MRFRFVTISAVAASVLAIGGLTQQFLKVASAHCQIPCGIYNDEARFVLMEEDVATIEKSMKQIQEIGSAARPNWNQLVRWIDNKEEHAEKLTHIATYYFLAQRIKPVDLGDKVARARYFKHLTLIHLIVVNAMKAKQTTDLKYCEQLRKLIKEFKESYLGKQTAGLHKHGESNAQNEAVASASTSHAAAHTHVGVAR